MTEAIEFLSDDELARIDAWWRADMYLTVAQIYLQDNVLLREPLAGEHIKPRLLGHWGTSPGLAFIYAHMSRLIRAARPGRPCTSPDPGHGGPALTAASWLEGTWAAGLPGHPARRRGACAPCAAGSARPAASRATSASPHPGRSTRAASSATC